MKNYYLAILSLALVAAAPAPSPYERAGSIPGPDGGWDYASIDPVHHRLFIAHGDSIMMVDLAQKDRVRSLGPVAHAHAVVPIPGSDLLAVTSGHDSTIRLFDVVSGKQIASIGVPEDPDAAIIDQATGHLLTMNAHAGSVSEIDPDTKTLLRSVSLKPGLEYAAIGPRHTLYVNNEDENEIETLDLSSGTPGKVIPLPGCEGPTGLALDRAHGRLITACANDVAKVVDVATGAVVDTLPIGAGPDAVLIDARAARLLIPCGKSGSLEVFGLGDHIRKLASIRTERGARTGAVDEATGRVYLPTAEIADNAKEQRTVLTSSSFHVLVLNKTR